MVTRYKFDTTVSSQLQPWFPVAKRFRGRKLGKYAAMHRAILLLLWLSPVVSAEDLRQAILQNPKSPFYLDFAAYPRQDPGLPIGIFDSGTGGLTVLNAVVSYDEHQNQSGEEGADGIPDFAQEDLIYLADQANMPYGTYPGLGKTDLLQEHVLKCARFLLGREYYGQGPCTDKKPIKAMVIACNTATAYGKSSIEDLLREGHSDLKVIGVIDAGARGALAALPAGKDATIGIFATAGTVASGGYQRALQQLSQQRSSSGRIELVSQAGVGLAEAIDEEPDFIDRKATRPRSNYRGPSIELALMPYYGFDTDPGKLLCDGPDCQLNDADNYTRYHIVSMLEQMRSRPDSPPLRAIILGCTHYPYVKTTISQVLDQLRKESRYTGLIAEQVQLVDPAQNTARELYQHLREKALANPGGSLRNSEFYISVPNPELAGVQLEAGGARFTYAYKYGRSAGEGLAYVRQVPFSRQNLSEDVCRRLQQQIPEVYRLIQLFDRNSPKTRYLPEDQKL